MKSTRFLFLFVLVAALVALLFFYQGGFNRLFNDFRALFFSFWDRSFDYAKLKKMEVENQGLKNELETIKARTALSSDFSYKEFSIYSAYPFNDRRLIVIDGGSNHGLKPEMPVLAAEGVLLGKIKSVKSFQSVVQTVFDPDWRLSVAIGNESEQGLLKGGSEPILELIFKEAVLKTGDRVLNTSPEYPLHLLIGSLISIKSDQNNLWLSAGLAVPYDLENLRTVLVVTNFP